MSSQTRSPKISLGVDGGRAEGLACADPGARTSIGVSGNFASFVTFKIPTVIDGLIWLKLKSS